MATASMPLICSGVSLSAWAGIWVAAPVDFSDLSSEYIGILYEGLLDFELKTAPAGDPVIFLAMGDQPALPLSRLVIAGTRGEVRLHAHLADPAQLFATAARFGTVSREKSDDTRAPSPAAPRQQVAIVTDSGADIPAEALDRLNIHVVPVRISIGGRDFVDGVSISLRELYDAMRTSPVPPRTSQPPPGDYRRMFEFLVAHHERVIDVSIARALSGAVQSAEGAAARTDADRISVFDSGHAAAKLAALIEHTRK